MTSVQQIVAYVQDAYGVVPDCPFQDTEALVFRHAGSRKWFAVLMAVPAAKLGLPGDGLRDILNLKCDPRLSGSLRAQEGVLPAYHMNKEHWITLVLDSSFPTDELFALIDLSHHLTQ